MNDHPVLLNWIIGVMAASAGTAMGFILCACFVAQKDDEESYY